MEAVMRGAAGAIFARDKVSHPLLLLMPYGSDAPKHLRRLEATVVMALDQKEDEESRTTAALSLREIVYQPCMRIPDHGLLLIEVLRCLTSELPRPVLLEELAIAYLSRDGIRIETGCSVDPAGAPLPRLFRDELLQPSPTVVEHVGHFDEALKIWSDVADKLLWLDLEKVRSMSPEDICACLRMLVLYLLHTPGPELGNGQTHRLELFQTTGLSVWNLLLERLKELSSLEPDLEEQFGDGAQRALWHRLRGDWLLKQKVQAPMERAVCRPQQSPQPGTLLVIADKIPQGASDEDRETLRRYERLRQPIPVAPLPEVTAINTLVAKLAAEFPWARRAIDELAADLTSRRLFGGIELGTTPTLLVGMPGCGKSRLVRRIAEELRVPFRPLSLAGMNDSMALLGTARGWATGQASPLVDTMLQHTCASALVLLDEVDKVGMSSRNSVSPTVALLNLLEPENAKRWYDTFLQVNCDLSKLMFWATANSLQPITKPLLSRFRILLIEQPKPSDFAAIVRGALCDIAREWGLNEATLVELAPEICVQSARTARDVRAQVRTQLHRWSCERLGPGHLH